MRVQIFKPLQAAIVFIQAETDPFPPMLIANIIAAQCGEGGNTLASLELTDSEDKEFMAPYLDEAISQGEQDEVSSAAAGHPAREGPQL